MTFVSEKAQAKRLREYGISVQTEFWEDHKIRIRSTDHSRGDDVRNGIVLQKKYFRNGERVHLEKDFSPLIKYTYLGGKEAAGSITCPNCGFEAKGSDFGDGCPYCGAGYNIEYADRKEGGQFNADRNVKSTGFYIAALFICLAVCLPVSFFLVKTTGRTFMFFDKLKAVAFGVIPALILFYFFFVANAFVITRLAEKKYEEQTELIRRFEKDLRSLGIPLSTFYNNLHSELDHLFYGERSGGSGDGDAGRSGEKAAIEAVDADRVIGDTDRVVDTDILECRDFNICEGLNGQPDICLSVKLRKILVKGERLCPEEALLRIRMRENEILPDELHPGANIVHCRNCGAPVDVTKAACEYCGTRINYMQRLYITSLE